MCSKTESIHKNEECYFLFLECGAREFEGQVKVYSDSTKDDGLDNQIALFEINYNYYLEENHCSINDNCYDDYKYEFKLDDLVKEHVYYFRLSTSYNDDIIQTITYNNESIIEVNFYR